MLTHETILTFWLASTLLALAPSPDNLFVLTQSALNKVASTVFAGLALKIAPAHR